MSKLARLKELQQELDETYREMNDILNRNGLSKKNLFKLPPDELKRWKELNLKSVQLIGEFSDLLQENRN